MTGETDWQEYRRRPETRYARPVTEHTTVQTSHGEVEAAPGDYLVRGPDGELWPVSGDKFFTLYEPVEGDDGQ